MHFSTCRSGFPPSNTLPHSPAGHSTDRRTGNPARSLGAPKLAELSLWLGKPHRLGLTPFKFLLLLQLPSLDSQKLKVHSMGLPSPQMPSGDLHTLLQNSVFANVYGQPQRVSWPGLRTPEVAADATIRGATILCNSIHYKLRSPYGAGYAMTNSEAPKPSWGSQRHDQASSSYAQRRTLPLLRITRNVQTALLRGFELNQALVLSFVPFVAMWP